MYNYKYDIIILLKLMVYINSKHLIILNMINFKCSKNIFIKPNRYKNHLKNRNYCLITSMFIIYNISMDKMSN